MLEIYPVWIVFQQDRCTYRQVMLELAFGITFRGPTVTHRQLLQVLVALTVPMVMYRITRMTAVLNWRDVTVAMGLVMAPLVVLLALNGVVGDGVVTGILSAIALSSLGVIDTD